MSHVPDVALALNGSYNSTVGMLAAKAARQSTNEVSLLPCCIIPRALQPVNAYEHAQQGGFSLAGANGRANSIRLQRADGSRQHLHALLWEDWVQVQCCGVYCKLDEHAC